MGLVWSSSQPSTKWPCWRRTRSQKAGGWEKESCPVFREIALFCLYTAVLYNPCAKPEGRSIPSLREVTVQIASWQRACKNGAEDTGFCTVDPAGIGRFNLSFRCLVFTRCFLAQRHARPNKKGADDLYPPQCSHLFSLFLKDEKDGVQVSLWWESQRTMYNRSTLNSGWPQAPQEGYWDCHHVHLCS